MYPQWAAAMVLSNPVYETELTVFHWIISSACP